MSSSPLVSSPLVPRCLPRLHPRQRPGPRMSEAAAPGGSRLHRSRTSAAAGVIGGDRAAARGHRGAVPRSRPSPQCRAIRHLRSSVAPRHRGPSSTRCWQGWARHAPPVIPRGLSSKCRCRPAWPCAAARRRAPLHAPPDELPCWPSCRRSGILVMSCTFFGSWTLGCLDAGDELALFLLCCKIDGCLPADYGMSCLKLVSVLARGDVEAADGDLGPATLRPAGRGVVRARGAAVRTEVRGEGERRKTGVLWSIRLYSRKKLSQGESNNFFRVRHGIDPINSNGRSPNHENCNGIDPINPF